MTAWKIQLYHELNNIFQKDMSVMDYTSKIKDISNSLNSIDINVDEDEMVQVYLGCLTQWFDPVQIEILTRENPVSFFDLQFMLNLIEENHVNTKSKASKGQIFYSHSDVGHGQGHERRGWFNRNRGGHENGSSWENFARGSLSNGSNQHKSIMCSYYVHSATSRRNTEGRRVQWWVRAGNSPIMQLTLTMKIMLACSSWTTRQTLCRQASQTG